VIVFPRYAVHFFSTQRLGVFSPERRKTPTRCLGVFRRSDKKSPLGMKKQAVFRRSGGFLASFF